MTALDRAFAFAEVNDIAVFVGENPTYGATRSLFWFDMKDLPKNQAVTDARMDLYLREAGPAGDPARPAGPVRPLLRDSARR